MISEKISSVRFGVDEVSLLAGDDIQSCDAPASLQRYCDLCKETLLEIFVDAEIEIVRDSTLRIEINGILSHPQADTVEQVKENVYQEYRWIVERPTWSIEDVSKRFSMSIPLLEWACQEGLILEAKATSGIWRFPQTSFLDLRANKAFSKCNQAARLSSSDNKYIFEESLSYDVLNSSIEQLSSGDIFLVLPTLFQRLPWFTKENFILLVSLENFDVTLEIIQFFGNNTPLEMKWSPGSFAENAKKQAQQFSLNSTNISIGVEIINSIGGKRINSIRYVCAVTDLEKTNLLVDIINRIMDDVCNIAIDAEIALTGGIQWKQVYEQNEELFSLEVLRPLLWRMGYIKVEYIHGPREKGKDFVFSEINKFNELQHYGLQAKAGNVKGNATGDVRKLFNQARDAFDYTYKGINDSSPKRICVFIIAISGNFTDEAEDKIKNMTTQHIGLIYFLDKQRILELIKQYWP